MTLDTAFSNDYEEARLAGELGVNKLVARILIQRGCSDPAIARGFIDPDFYRPQPPDALPGVRQAAQVVRAALEQGRRILVWGDFDVDGQTATALLMQAFDDLAPHFNAGSCIAETRYHIPVRAAEGHGVGLAALQGFLDAPNPPELLVTCDTGITAFEALAFARARGVAVVVTDHHELALENGEARLPEVDAVVTPRLLPPGSPLAGLPGVGVAYKLVEALYEAAGRVDDAEAYLDLTALGIVADVAEQTGDTRYLLQLGLHRLRKTARQGLLAIYERAGLKAEALNEEHIGFSLGPRLNALGRLGDANPAVELLTTPDASRARLLALQLEGLNARRQLLTSQTLRAALSQVEADPALLDGSVLTLAHPTWEAGIIGIVAGRLAERFGKPAVLIAAPAGSPGRGSARSTPGVHITAALAANAALLRAFGGHALAAGFTLDAEMIPALRRGLNRAADLQLAQARSAERNVQSGAQVFGADLESGAAQRVDAYVDWEAIDLELADDIERLAPFGPGNPPPALACSGVTLAGHAGIGRTGEHLALRLSGPDGRTRRALWWGGADFVEQLPPPEIPFEAVITLRSSGYRASAGAREAQIEWLGYRRPPAGLREVPKREVEDYRGTEHALRALKAWLERFGIPAGGAAPLPAGDDAGVFVWAEGDARRELAERLPGVAVGGRDEIPVSEALAVWTIPPGPSELAEALGRSEARQAALFAVDPGMDSAQAFLERLAGLARAAQRAQGGAVDDSQGGAGVDLAHLAAAAAQREAAVRIGLSWLEAQGHITARISDRRVFFSPGRLSARDQQSAAEILKRLRDLLAETRAYRNFYTHAELDALQIG